MFREDWVNVFSLPEQKSVNGFGVQTLKRFRNGVDSEIEGRIDDLLGIVKNIPGLEDLTKALTTVRSWVELNRMHFLAGRRSWIFGVESKGNSNAVAGQLDNNPDLTYDESDVFYLETAAVERYSKLYKLIKLAPIDISGAVVSTWTTMLSNYVNDCKGYALYDQQAPPKEDGRDWSKSNGVWYRAGESRKSEFETLKSRAWVKNIFELHPRTPNGLKIAGQLGRERRSTQGAAARIQCSG